MQAQITEGTLKNKKLSNIPSEIPGGTSPKFPGGFSETIFGEILQEILKPRWQKNTMGNWRRKFGS